ncbi:hypothetical protein RRG08_029050 [Elysia crispata]|uniref:FYVE, RhoGEF and PH domain-containing protein 6 n=1 Tax=Elysia crispata TaxID=231223 RepID=A0AAE0ZK73_9GAST|nr:hypothetical protein RRG08_029050 [Elysia crispata]
MASPPTISLIEETADSQRQCLKEASFKKTSVPRTPHKPPVAAKPSRRPAPPPPPPKPQSLKLAISPPTKRPPGFKGKDSVGLENGTTRTTRAVSTEELPSDEESKVEAGPGTSPPQRPPLPTSPPPVQRKGPLSPSSSASLPASFRNQPPKSESKHPPEQIKNSPSLPSVPFQQQTSPHQTCQKDENTNSSLSPGKTSPAKRPKPAVPPKTAHKPKAPIPNVKPPFQSSYELCLEGKLQAKLEISFIDKKDTVQKKDSIAHGQSTANHDSNASEDLCKPSLCMSPGSKVHVPDPPCRSDHVSSLPEASDKCSPLLVTSLDSGAYKPEDLTEHPPKRPPPPLPKNPPRGGLPRKARTSLSKKPPERPAPPKPTPESTLDKDISTDVPLSTTNSKECEAGTEASVEIDIERRSDQENIASDERGVNPQVTCKQATAPKPRPRTSLSIPPKPPEEEKQAEAGSNSEDKDDARADTAGVELEENKREAGHSDSSTPVVKSLAECGKTSEPVPAQEDCPNKSFSQPELELDYVEVYRGEDGERSLRSINSASATELNCLKTAKECDISASASRGSISAKSLDALEPEPTCGMLKEIEDLLNKKLEDFDQASVEAEAKESPCLKLVDNGSISGHSSPVRPPRPKHQASLALRKGSFDSLSLKSPNGSHESLTSLGTERKVAPPKPKRTSTPRVSRSHSDVSGLRSPIVHSPEGEGFSGKFPQLQSDGKPYLPPRSESLRKNDSLISGRESPPPLPPRNRSRTAIETFLSSPHTEAPPLPERVSLISPSLSESVSLNHCASDQQDQEDMKSHRNSGPPGLTTVAAGEGLQNTDIFSSRTSPVPRPTRKAPPPPPNSRPRRSATLGPSDAKHLSAFEASDNMEKVRKSTSSEEPDYHEIPPEGLMGRSASPPPRLPPRVIRSKSLCSKEVAAVEISLSEPTALKGKDKKGSSLERRISLKSKNKKEEEQSRERKAKTALIQRVTQGLGLKKTFRKSKSPESLSSKTSDSSSEIEVEGPLSPPVDQSEGNLRIESCEKEGNPLQGSNSVQSDMEASFRYENGSHIAQMSNIEKPVTVQVCNTESDQPEEKESELPSPAMERLGMEDLESEVMSALSSGCINSNLGQDLASESKERPRSYRSTSTSSEREAGEEGQEEQDGEALSSASDSEPEPEEDKEEIYAIRKAKKVYFIAKEIMSSEGVFVDVLKLLNVDFRVHISNATEKLGQPVIATTIMNKILAYLPQLQDFNEYLLRDLTDRIKNWEDNPRLADIFVQKGPFLKLYSSYIRNFETSTATLDEATKKHPQFAAALKEFEMSPRCANLALKHYMLKPIQRIPQYKLLLQDYLKQLSPASVDFKDTLTALNIVSEVADHANESMRHGDNVHKLLEIQRSLVGSFEVIQPGRVLIMQGELEKVSRKEMQPRMFFLFSDVLLYTTPVTTGNKINNILPLIGMKVISPKLEDHENEFNIISVQRSFTLCASTPELKQQWVDSLQKAIEENAKRHNTFEAVKQGPQTSLSDKDFVLGHKAPLWVPDARVTMCMLCLVEFTLTWRRHHCRSCGRIICAQCSQNKAPLRYLKYKPSRVCDECFDKLKEVVIKEVANEKNKKKKRSSISAEEDSNTSITDDGPSTSFAVDGIDGEGADQAVNAQNAAAEHQESGLTLHNLLGRFTKIRSSNTRQQRMSGNLRPSVLREVHANDEGSDMSGYLYTFKSRKWKKMWFVVKGQVLYTYRASADMAAVESMPLLGYEVSEFETVFEGTEPGLLIELRHQNNQPLTSRASKSLSGADRAIQRTVLKTESAAATSKWVAALRQASQT